VAIPDIVALATADIVALEVTFILPRDEPAFLRELAQSFQLRLVLFRIRRLGIRRLRILCHNMEECAEVTGSLVARRGEFVNIHRTAPLLSRLCHWS
jgi:hypothetical protein